MLTELREGDVIIARVHRARTLLFRDGDYYSVNVISDSEYEIRYKIERESELVFLGFKGMELKRLGFS